MQPMGERIEIILDGRPTKVEAGQSLWQAAKQSGIDIPHLCLSTEPEFRADGNCRVCMVEIEGWRALVASCIVVVEPGMKVWTQSERVRKVRRVVMELLRADVTPVPDSEMAYWCETLDIDDSPFPNTRTKHNPDDSHVGMMVDLNACIDCRRCIQACGEIGCYDVIGMANRGARQKIVFDLDDPMAQSTCASCGACAQTCPTGAIRFRGEE
jgi:formate dehydrogenase major subunit